MSFTLNGQKMQYAYDGDGRRVEKTNPDGAALVMVYDAGGKLIAEYTSDPVTPAGGGGSVI